MIPGDGVEGTDGWRLGRQGWASNAAPPDEPAIDLGQRGAHVARFLLSDRVIADAVGIAEAVGRLSLEAKAALLTAASQEQVAFVRACTGTRRGRPCRARRDRARARG